LIYLIDLSLEAFFDLRIVPDFAENTTVSNNEIFFGRKNRQLAISEMPQASVSERVFVRHHSYENEFRPQVHLYENKSQSHFHMKGFAPGLVLNQKDMVTQNWRIV